ncbi:DUF421 domain-containing protein [Metallumcola ferriviriculae]|uniref:DUF421 domain-containing protein n=1 Tax=Metallumcola ferriviriculae TaxID=3039180 RepID=A0AAU0UL38_9FIRM|nr:DUF421 domain-containing protein [Desulfitibacteraceae bacterium MK1]
MQAFEVFVQTLLAFSAIFIYARILGKQLVSQLTFFEYVTGITFGSIAATIATDVNQRTITHFIGLTIFSLLTYLMQVITLKNRPARKIIEGEPVVVIQNGKLLEDKMAVMHYNVDELQMQLRSKGYFNINDVEYAIMEPNGELSVLAKSQKRPVTPEDLQLSTDYEGIDLELIIDGEVIYQNLSQDNLDMDWLKDQLRQRGVQDLNQVVYAGLDCQGNLFLDLVDDSKVNNVDVTDNPPD